MTDLFVNTDAATMSPVALFLQADLVVKIVMAGLLLASAALSAALLIPRLLLDVSRVRP